MFLVEVNQMFLVEVNRMFLVEVNRMFLVEVNQLHSEVFLKNIITEADHVHTLHLKTIMTKEEDMVIMEVDKDHVVVLWEEEKVIPDQDLEVDLFQEVALYLKAVLVQDHYLDSEVIQDLDAEVIQDLDAEVIQDLDAEVIQDLDAEVIQDLDAEVIQNLEVHLCREEEVIQELEVRLYLETVILQDHHLDTELIQDPEVALCREEEVIQDLEVALCREEEVIQDLEVGLSVEEEVVQDPEVHLSLEEEVIQDLEVGLYQETEIVWDYHPVQEVSLETEIKQGLGAELIWDQLLKVNLNLVVDQDPGMTQSRKVVAKADPEAILDLFHQVSITRMVIAMNKPDPYKASTQIIQESQQVLKMMKKSHFGQVWMIPIKLIKKWR